MFVSQIFVLNRELSQYKTDGIVIPITTNYEFIDQKLRLKILHELSDGDWTSLVDRIKNKSHLMRFTHEINGKKYVISKMDTESKDGIFMINTLVFAEKEKMKSIVIPYLEECFTYKKFCQLIDIFVRDRSYKYLNTIVIRVKNERDSRGLTINFLKLCGK